MELHQLEALIKKYNAGECTQEEKLWLEQWYLSFEWNKPDDLPDVELAQLKHEVWDSLQRERNRSLPIGSVATEGPRRLPGRWWYYSAAAVAIFIVSSVLFTRRNDPKPEAATVAQTVSRQDFLPGTSKASLVLGDGSIVSLDSAAVTQLKEGDGTTIDKKYGKIVYNNAAGTDNRVIYNTLNIPRGAEYQLVLPDGSKVWLNAASSLRFPTRFTGKDRSVYLTGEAYFEITKNTAQPFRVITTDGMEVEVVGTHFNVMAYKDEEYIKTTLTEGKVRIKNDGHMISLSPSQQAALQKNTQQLNVKQADIDKEIAWKNGMIEFSDDDLPYIMRQLSRWYDVDVSFEGSIPKGSYNGSIPRRATLTEVMQILKLAGVKYWLDNKRVVITGG